MYSLCTAFPLPDIKATFALIRAGGPKAQGMSSLLLYNWGNTKNSLKHG